MMMMMMPASCPPSRAWARLLALTPLPANMSLAAARVCHMSVPQVPAARVTDTVFWFMIYRMMVYPSPDHGPKVFYERLLPYLNSKPLMANVDADTTPWRCPPLGNDTTHAQC
eukprot:COSAG01_NODE_53745_length_337_cov_0.478992_1_plen_112_part_11